MAKSERKDLQHGPKISLDAKQRAAVKERRAKKGWDQKTLAARIGVSQGTISNLENGKHPQVYLNVYAEIQRVLKGDVDDVSGERFRRIVDKLVELDERDLVATEAFIDTISPPTATSSKKTG